jgi:hypothetical protein
LYVATGGVRPYGFRTAANQDNAFRDKGRDSLSYSNGSAGGSAGSRIILPLAEK